MSEKIELVARCVAFLVAFFSFTGLVGMAGVLAVISAAEVFGPSPEFLVNGLCICFLTGYLGHNAHKLARWLAGWGRCPCCSS